MDFGYQIIPASHLILERFTGSTSLADVLEATRELWADPAYDPQFDILCDLTHARPFGSPRDIKVLHRFLCEETHTSRGRVATVIDNPLLTALAMLYCALPSKHSCRIFSTLSRACDFLGIENSPHFLN